MRNVRTKVPSQVAAAAHFAAQVADCPVEEVYGVLLMTTVTRMSQEEVSQWVKVGLPMYRETISSEIASPLPPGF